MNNQLDLFSYQQEIKKDIVKKSSVREENQKLLDMYKMTVINKGLTEQSIVAKCKYDLKVFLEYIGDNHVADITHMDIQMFLLYCKEKRNNGDQALARKFTSVNMLYKTLINMELICIKSNPMDKLDKPKVRKKQREHVSSEEYEKIIDYLDSKKDLRGTALISLYFSSGCRLSEIYQLNRNDLNFETRRFKVLGKGDKERTATFSEDAKEKILAYLNSRIDDLEPLFISREKNRWGKSTIQQFLKKVAKEAGVKRNIHIHLLRHGRAMHLLKNGARLETIQRVLGHASIATTQIYAHMDIDMVQNEVDLIDNVG